MYEFGVPARDRLQIYDLTADQIKNLLVQASKDSSFIEKGVEFYAASVAKSPTVSDAYRKNTSEIRKVITQHFNALFSGKTLDRHDEAAAQTAEMLTDLGADAPAIFAAAAHVFTAYATMRGNRRFAVGMSGLANELAIMHRFLLCDARTALANASAEKAMERNKTISTLVQGFSTVANEVAGELAVVSGQVTLVTDHVVAAAGSALTCSLSADTAARNNHTGLIKSTTKAQELSQATHDVDRHAQISKVIVSDARNAAKAATTAIKGLQEAVGKIGSVIDLISSIAENTNLLALNATIEAARAGAAGKGFAVVAQEVKALASQTKDATQDVIAHINAVQSSTDGSFTQIEQIGVVLDNLFKNSEGFSESVKRHSEITKELSQGLKTFVDEVSSTSVSYAQAASLIDETSSEAIGLQKRMLNMKELGDQLSATVLEFGEKVKAA